MEAHIPYVKSGSSNWQDCGFWCHQLRFESLPGCVFPSWKVSMTRWPGNVRSSSLVKTVGVLPKGYERALWKVPWKPQTGLENLGKENLRGALPPPSARVGLALASQLLC
jgi:hypothetical protein